MIYEPISEYIQVGNESVGILLFADGIAVLAENEADLQACFDILDAWCKKWIMKINCDKTKIIHFRNPAVPRSECVIRCGNDPVSFIEKYKYLGLWLTEFLDKSLMAKELSKTAHRALGLLIAKAKAYGGMPFTVYTHLYNSQVLPIITYGSSIWGQSEFSCINAVHNRACRSFLGVGKRTPNTAVQGDMGWPTPWYHQWLSVTRAWCSLSSCMEETRLHKRIYKWSFDHRNRKNWPYRNQVFYNNARLEFLNDTTLQLLYTGT